MTVRPEIQALAEWLEREAAASPFGEFGVKIVLHDGTISRIEKSTVEKTRPSNGKPGGRHEARR